MQRVFFVFFSPGKNDLLMIKISSVFGQIPSSSPALWQGRCEGRQLTILRTGDSAPSPSHHVSMEFKPFPNGRFMASPT